MLQVIWKLLNCLVSIEKCLILLKKIFQYQCSRSLGDRSTISYAQNAGPVFRSRLLRAKIQNQKLCSRSLASKFQCLRWMFLPLDSTLNCIIFSRGCHFGQKVDLGGKITFCSQSFLHHLLSISQVFTFFKRDFK